MHTETLSIPVLIFLLVKQILDWVQRVTNSYNAIFAYQYIDFPKYNDSLVNANIVVCSLFNYVCNKTYQVCLRPTII